MAICTRDRTATISATLDSLERQMYETFEILVVDNAPSTAATERLVRANYPGVRFIREPRPGLNHARNRAVREARGTIVAFIDDAFHVQLDPVDINAETFKNVTTIAELVSSKLSAAK